MAKVKYNNITFDSDLEVNYYKYLKEQKIKFKYHLPYRIELDFMEKGYTPDFVLYLNDGEIIKIVETKGYNQFSFRVDGMIHNSMKKLIKTERGQLFFKEWLEKNGISTKNLKEIQYQKIKYLKKHGFVDFSFKPKTLKDQWKENATTLNKELKLVKKELKDYKRYIEYLNKEKLTKPQRDWKLKFEANIGLI